MHHEAMEFIRGYQTSDPVSVIEIGSRNINGTVRDLFPNATWVGLDLYPGRCVDVVCDAENWSPVSLVDLVICCEVFEHARRWYEIIQHSSDWLNPGGKMLITCGGPNRPPHSHHDGGRLRRGEYYANVSADEIKQAMWASGLTRIKACQVFHDTHAVGEKPE